MTTELGFIQPAVGSNSPITINFPGLVDTRPRFNTLYLQVGAGNTGDIYFGRSGFNKTTKVGLIAILRPPTANHLPDLAFNIPSSVNPFMLSGYDVTCDQPGDGVQITALEA